MSFRQTKERKSFGNGLTTGLKSYSMLHLLFHFFKYGISGYSNRIFDFSTEIKTQLFSMKFGIVEEIGIAYWKITKPKLFDFSRKLELVHDISGRYPAYYYAIERRSATSFLLRRTVQWRGDAKPLSFCLPAYCNDSMNEGRRWNQGGNPLTCSPVHVVISKILRAI